ncbi:MAG: FtsX-like permease family protein [bacterium]|nr:FtsX-like permease family protein [bacterium]
MNKIKKNPPRTAKMLLQFLIGRETHYSCIGDIEEIYNEVLEDKGRVSAYIWFYSQIIKIISNKLRNSVYWSTVMLRNYIKITLRNIRKNKGYSFLNIMGLAIGIAVCILIFSYIFFELKFDRFHQNSDRIYRLTLEASFAGQNIHTATSSAPAAGALKADYPEVISAVRFSNVETAQVKYGEKEFLEAGMFHTDNSVFEIFTFPIITGDDKIPLIRPYTAVITEETARKYFGDEDPVGKILRINITDEYEITAVMLNIPANSHIKFDILLSFETLVLKNKAAMQAWVPLNYYTYTLLQKNYDYRLLDAKMNDFTQRYMGGLLKAIGGTAEFRLQPFRDIHLHSHLESEISANSNYYYIYIFAVTALFILFLACINFMNLSTSRSISRAKEIGIRKVMGSEKGNLIRQFLGEAIFFSIISLVIALIIVKLAMPFFSIVSGRELEINYLQPVWLLPVFLLAAVVVGVIAGSYPAFFLSSFRPIEVLKSKSGKMGLSDIKIRNVLVVFQFIISISLIIGTLVIYQQTNYMKNEKLGFNKEHVIVVPLKADIDRDSVPQMRDIIKQHPGISSVTFSSRELGGGQSGDVFMPEGAAENQTIIMGNINTGPEFVETAQLELISGRNFSPELTSEQDKTVIINETAAKRFGLDDPVGKNIIYINDVGLEGRVVKKVVGMVKDFHNESMHKVIEPLVINYGYWDLNYIMVRIRPDNIPGVIEHLESNWENIDPAHSFDYYFLDEAYDRQFRAEEKLMQIFINFSFLGILIACLGLLGLSAYSAEQRTKEIGIRKALGAQVSGIVYLLNREFIRLIVIAALIACPISYILITKWLENFPYRTDLSLLTFIISLVIILIIALSTVVFQAVKAAYANPVKSLRYE